MKGKISELTKQFEGLTPRIEQYDPVTVGHFSKGTSLDVIKSLPEFRGENQTYSAWREAEFIYIYIYCTKGTENYYVAMGIFRNKITGAANAELSAFNMDFNFKALKNENGPITIAIDCNGYSLVIFEENLPNYASGLKSAPNSDLFWVRRLLNVWLQVLCAPNATILLIYIPAKIKMTFI